MHPEALIDHLVKEKVISRSDVRAVSRAPSQLHKPIEFALLDEALIDESRLYEAMVQVYGFEPVDLEPELLDPELASRLPQPLLESFCVYPLKRDGDVIPLAMADPFDVTAEDTIRYITGLEIKPILARRSQIRRAISGELMDQEGFKILVQQVPCDFQYESVHQLLESGTYSSEKATPIIVLVNAILNDGIRKRASDVHLEPAEEAVRVRYRIDGILRNVVELPKRVEKACVSRVKIISGLDISESRKPQDGRTSFRGVDMRVSTLPTNYGEKVVLRLLNRAAVVLELTQLGFLHSDLEILKGFLRSSHGMILHTGPTGSGKTSSLYAALRLLNSPTVNITTVEDPIEYKLHGISQVQVNVKAGVTFAGALRSFLRQDPDIIMVGEIRDLETAEIAVQAAQTGHLVLSTLHTNDAPTTLTRLVMMGLEPHMVAGSLLCVVAQRLVRRLCENCRTVHTMTADQKRLLKGSVEGKLPKKLYRSAGCEACDFSGYRGRLGLFELLPATTRIRQQMLDDASEEPLWRVARKEGMKTLLEDGLLKVEAGLTSLDEVLRVVTIKRASSKLLSPRKVVDVMTSELVYIHPHDKLSDVTVKFLEKGVTGGPVADENGQVVGVISFNDVAVYSQAPPPNNGELTAGEIMSRRVYSVQPQDSVDTATELFRRYKVHRLLVAEGDRTLGIITPMDLVLRG